MFGVPKNIRDFPLEIVYLISKYLKEEDKLSLAVSEAHKRYSSLYGTTRGLVINYKCFYILSPGSKPGSWDHYFTEYLTPETIISFSVNDCYWLTGDHIIGYIKKMTNLQALGISGTKISLGQLTTVFESCKKIMKLDFSYQHLSSLTENSSQFNKPAVRETFKKLICLKVSTSVRDFRDYLNDPWLFIYNILSWLQQCQELTLEITHTGDIITLPIFLPPLEINGICHRFLAKMRWMKTSLKSLAIIKSGSFNNFADTQVGPLGWGRLNVIRSAFVDNLLNWMFPTGPAQALALERLWIHDFYVSPGRNRVLSVAPNLKAFKDVRRENDRVDGYDTFRERLEELGNCAFAPLPHLPNLKFANGQFFIERDPQNLRDFIGAHRNLEYLGIDYEGEYVPTDEKLQLLKLKSLYCACEITKDVVDDLAKAYPNIKALKLQTLCDDMETRSDRDSLSAIRFQHLTSLSLDSFNFQDGTFLKKLIEQNPKLERLYFMGAVSLRTPFLLNHLNIFLKKAPKLRDFMLYGIEFRNNVSDALILLKFLERCSSHLERVSLRFDRCISPADGDWGQVVADFLVEFAMKMERLTALCLIFHGIDPGFLQEANRRIAEEVIPLRPSLWFHLDSKLPDPADPSVPDVHYREMVDLSGMLRLTDLPTFVSPMS